MRTIIIILLMMIAVLLAGQGCQEAPSAIEPTTQPTQQTTTQPTQQTTTEQPTKTPQKCNYLYEGKDVKKIELGEVEIDEQSLSFNIIPQTDNGSIVAADGFATVKIYSTRFILGERATDYEVYRNSFRLDDEDVAGDCSSEIIKISFADIQKSEKYKFVKEDDPGMMFVEFSVTGSRTIFETKYEPEKYGKSLLK